MRSLPVAGDGVIGARRIARQPEAADGVVAVVIEVLMTTRQQRGLTAALAAVRLPAPTFPDSVSSCL